MEDSNKNLDENTDCMIFGKAHTGRSHFMSCIRNKENSGGLFGVHIDSLLTAKTEDVIPETFNNVWPQHPDLDKDIAWYKPDIDNNHLIIAAKHAMQAKKVLVVGAGKSPIAFDSDSYNPDDYLMIMSEASLDSFNNVLNQAYDFKNIKITKSPEIYDLQAKYYLDNENIDYTGYKGNNRKKSTARKKKKAFKKHNKRNKKRRK